MLQPQSDSRARIRTPLSWVGSTRPAPRPPKPACRWHLESARSKDNPSPLRCALALEGGCPSAPAARSTGFHCLAPGRHTKASRITHASLLLSRRLRLRPAVRGSSLCGVGLSRFSTFRINSARFSFIRDSTPFGILGFFFVHPAILQHRRVVVDQSFTSKRRGRVQQQTEPHGFLPYLQTKANRCPARDYVASVQIKYHCRQRCPASWVPYSSNSEVSCPGGCRRPCHRNSAITVSGQGRRAAEEKLSTWSAPKRSHVLRSTGGRSSPRIGCPWLGRGTARNHVPLASL